MNSLADIINGIEAVIKSEEKVLLALPDDVISLRKNKQGRTIKQLIGHLIDSASNNHQRMVRLQYNAVLDFPDYTQDNDLWISLQNYQSEDWFNLVQLWKFYNLHIIQIIKTIDANKLDNYWHDFEGAKVTLKQMIDTYLWHLNLHIGEIHELIEHP